MKTKQVKQNKVYLAFRGKAPSNPTTFQTIATNVTKARLVSQYSHGGIVVNGDLYHVSTHGGLHKEDAGTWTPCNWDLYEIEADKEQVVSLYAKYKGTPYDWFSLLAFVGLSVKDSSKLYCFEWVYLALTGTNPNFRVTPEILLGLR